MSGRNKVSGADVRVRVGRGVVRIEVEQAVVVVAVVAAHVKHAGTSVRVHKPKAGSHSAGNPGEIIVPTGKIASIL